MVAGEPWGFRCRSRAHCAFFGEVIEVLLLMLFRCRRRSLGSRGDLVRLPRVEAPFPVILADAVRPRCHVVSSLVGLAWVHSFAPQDH